MLSYDIPACCFGKKGLVALQVQIASRKQINQNGVTKKLVGLWVGSLIGFLSKFYHDTKHSTEISLSHFDRVRLRSVMEYLDALYLLE